MKIINITDNKILIVADEGKWLANGNDYGQAISLADGVSHLDYYEITEEEYKSMQELFNSTIEEI